MALMRDAPVLVKKGYMNINKVVRSAGELLVIALLQVLLPVIFNDGGKKGAREWYHIVPILMYIFLFIFFLFLFLMFRQKKTTRVFNDQNRAQDAMQSQLERTESNFRMIGGYNRR